MKQANKAPLWGAVKLGGSAELFQLDGINLDPSHPSPTPRSGCHGCRLFLGSGVMSGLVALFSSRQLRVGGRALAASHQLSFLPGALLCVLKS